MARTSKSRGATPFTMKSGNTPLHNEVSGVSPMNKGWGKKIIGALTGGIGRVLTGGGADDSTGGSDIETKIDEIHTALVNNDTGTIGGGGIGEAIGGSTVDPVTLAAAKEEKALKQL